MVYNVIQTAAKSNNLFTDKHLGVSFDQLKEDYKIGTVNAKAKPKWRPCSL